MASEPKRPAPLDVNLEAKALPVEVRPPTTRGLAAWWLVLVVMLGGFGLLAADHLRQGIIVLATSLWVGALLRAVLPEQQSGGLVVRSRVFDTLALITLGAGILVIGLALRTR